jgi:hypothetical protein
LPSDNHPYGQNNGLAPPSDRTTQQHLRDYLEGKRTPGERAISRTDPFEEFAEYVKIRLADDPHLWATALFDEVVALGYAASYPSFTRGLRTRALRPHCESCAASTGRDHAIIEHRPGAETQFDWLELPDPPAWWAGVRRRTCSSARWIERASRSRRAGLLGRRTNPRPSRRHRLVHNLDCGSSTPTGELIPSSSSTWTDLYMSECARLSPRPANVRSIVHVVWVLAPPCCMRVVCPQGGLPRG